MMPTAAYIRRETLISVVINSLLSLVFFLGVFGLAHPVPVWGAGYVIDFVPQGFMIGLMATLVPGALAGKARRAGQVAAWDGSTALPTGLILRAITVALVSALGLVAAGAMVLLALGVQALPSLVGLAGKVGAGALLAVIVTPAGLRAALAAENRI